MEKIKYFIYEIKATFEAYRYKKMMLRFRSEMLFWGIDFSHCSDEEILRMTSVAAKEISKCGVTAEEFGEAIRRLSA